MHPLDFAMQLELDGKAFYLEQARLMEDFGHKEIFEELAADEEKHYQVLKQMKESGAYEFVESTVSEQAASIFTDPDPSKIPEEKFSSFVAIFQQALEFEEKAIDLYSDLASQAKSESERKAFLMLEREEEVHRALLWKVLQFLQRPEEWYPYIN